MNNDLCLPLTCMMLVLQWFKFSTIFICESEFYYSKKVEAKQKALI